MLILLQSFTCTNDFGTGVPLGNIDSTLPNEFYGALNIVALGLIKSILERKSPLLHLCKEETQLKKHLLL
ncbi:MAG TPA: hypothetical protein VNR61_18705, partial [Niallia sp.]|nr:hypothetical protein [Niallia sp.]